MSKRYNIDELLDKEKASLHFRITYLDVMRRAMGLKDLKYLLKYHIFPLMKTQKSPKSFTLVDKIIKENTNSVLKSYYAVLKDKKCKELQKEFIKLAEEAFYKSTKL